MLKNVLLAGIGGAAGSMLRYVVSIALPRQGAAFPWATLAVNLAGCLLIGLLAGLTPRLHWMAHIGWVLLATGLCGGFTTFSAFALDEVKLFSAGAGLTAILYLLISMAGGILLCFAGFQLTAPNT